MEDNVIRNNGKLSVKSCSASAGPQKHHVLLEIELCVMGLEGQNSFVWCVCVCVYI